MYCSSCGKEVPPGSPFCPNCGAPQSGQATPPPPPQYSQPPQYQYSQTAPGYEQKSKIVAGLLGILLGGLGIHRFYLGYVGIGVVQIVVTIVTFGLGSLWGFIEGILILTGSTKTDAKGIPLKD
jgi:hypothetical protein